MKKLRKKEIPAELAGRMEINFDTAKARKYIRENTGTKIGDVPPWVLLSLGVGEALKAAAEKRETEGKT